MFKADAIHVTLLGRAQMETLQPNKTVVDSTGNGRVLATGGRFGRGSS